MSKNLKIISFFLLGVSQFAFSQIREEQLILDRNREPEVKKIEKKQASVAVEKKDPHKEKRVRDSLQMKYTVTDLPAVSDFKPSPIKGLDISPNFSSDYQKNYLRAGMGNYGKILADANFSGNINEKTEAGADFHYLSATGLKQDYSWNSASSALDASVFLNHFGDKGRLNLDAGYSNSSINYYGIYAPVPPGNIDLKQNINQFGINGFYDFYSHNILDFASVKTNFLSDKFGADETSVAAKIGLAKNGITISSAENILLKVALPLSMESQNTSFAILNKNYGNYFDASAAPALTFSRGKSYIMVGSEFHFLSGNMGSDILQKSSGNRFYWFPKAEIYYAASAPLNLYAGVDGGLQLNSYAQMLQENPFLVSCQEIKPTETKFHAYIGAKGDVAAHLKYDISAGFAKINSILFYQSNGLFNSAITTTRAPYDFANTFSATYDNGTAVTGKIGLEYFPLENLSLDGAVNFSSYKLDHYKNIYNKAPVTATIGAEYSLINRKLQLGFKGIFSGNKNADSFAISPSGNGQNYLQTENTGTVVKGFADINISAEYKIHKNFSIFALGNNLLNTKYEVYKGYKVLGAQILGGIKISF